MSFTIYIIGYVILMAGLAYGAHMAHIPQRWIGVGVIIMIGLGIMSAVSRTRQRDPN
jgi:hypothetical protein